MKRLATKWLISDTTNFICIFLYFLTAFLGLNIDVKEITYGTESCPTPKEVLKAIACKYVDRQEPFNLEEFSAFVDHLERMHRLLVVDAHVDCLIVTVRCSSLQILDELWEDYRTGHLNEVAQKYLVTKEILKKFGLIELKLMTTIVEEEYRACRQYFLQWPGLYDSFRKVHLVITKKKINV